MFSQTFSLLRLAVEVCLQGPFLLQQVGQSCGNPPGGDIVFFLEVVNQFLKKFQFLTGHSLADLFLKKADPPLRNILAAGQTHGGDGLAGGMFDCRKQPSLPRGDKNNGLAGATGSTGAAYSVHIRLAVVRHIVIDYMADPLDIQASGGDIGGDHDIKGAVFELLDGFFPHLLGHVAIERGAGQAPGFQFFGQLYGHQFGADKDQHRLHLFGLKNLGQGIEFVHPFNLPEVLGNGPHGGCLAFNSDFHRVFQLTPSHP